MGDPCIVLTEAIIVLTGAIRAAYLLGPSHQIDNWLPPQPAIIGVSSWAVVLTLHVAEVQDMSKRQQSNAVDSRAAVLYLAMLPECHRALDGHSVETGM
ncbi:hypothetical protein ACLOJK_016430 [Asimina triloba]